MESSRHTSQVADQAAQLLAEQALQEALRQQLDRAKVPPVVHPGQSPAFRRQRLFMRVEMSLCYTGPWIRSMSCSRVAS